MTRADDGDRGEGAEAAQEGHTELYRGAECVVISCRVKIGWWCAPRTWTAAWITIIGRGITGKIGDGRSS